MASEISRGYLYKGVIYASETKPIMYLGPWGEAAASHPLATWSYVKDFEELEGPIDFYYEDNEFCPCEKFERIK